MNQVHAQRPHDGSARHPFAALGLSAPLVRAVHEEGYERPTPIQELAIPPVLDGRDLLGCAQTGTGKTAAFVLPTLQRLAAGSRTGKIRALVVAPTRELAAQIGERVAAYGKNVGLRHDVIYGGVGQRAQEEALRRRPDVLIATPGRLLDLVEQGFVKLDGVEILILDEADRMLDMGFIHDVRKIVALVPRARQTLLFSATIPVEIAKLVASILRDPVEVSVTPETTTAETVDQCVHYVPKHEKRALLERILRTEGALRTIVFTRTKHGANRLAEQLTRGGIESAAIHGNKSQGARERALEGFRTGLIPVLVATDLAARGIDVEGISHVVNFELPNVPESYVHRIGRTGRAGATGKAIAFCDAEERGLLRDIERFIKRHIPVASGEPAALERAVPPEGGQPARAPNRPNGSHGANASGGRRNGGSPGRGGQGGHSRPSTQAGAHGPQPSPSRPRPSAHGGSQGRQAPQPEQPAARPAGPPPLPGESTRRPRRYRGFRIA